MTAYATRSPLQLLTNTHYVMVEQRQSDRRASARLREKEDVPATNGTAHAQDKSKNTSRQPKANANGVAAEGRARLKRKPEYDEEDDGFMFTRAKSKRTKVVPAAQASEPKPLPSKRVSKKNPEPIAPEPKDSTDAAPRRRSTRNSGDKSIIEPSELPIPKRRPKRTSIGSAQKTKESEPSQGGQDAVPRTAHAINRSHTPDQRQFSSDITKIALPFADTPIIRRNKEMRKGSGEARRSSLSNRGRRASSLIDSGTSNALPHEEVEAADFYRHIESGLLEPRRMRQLLIWCGTRALGEKPSFATEDGPARLAAREIQQQLLKDFSSKSELSDWLSREVPPAQPQPLKPNPKNIANLAKIEELEQKLRQLQEERKTWEALLRPPAEPLLPPLPDQLLSVSSLSVDQHISAALASLQNQPNPSAIELSTSVRERVTIGAQTVQDEADKLVESVNSLQTHLAAAEDVGRKCLGGAARILEERDRRATDKEGAVGVRDVLRGLSRVAER